MRGLYVLSFAMLWLFLQYGLQARPGIKPVKRQVPHLVQERSDERHIIHFALRHKAVTHAHPHHHRQHIEMTRVVGRVHFRARRIHIFLAHHL